MAAIDSYGKKVIKEEENASPESGVEQPKGISESILRAILVELPSTETNPLHAPAVEKPTYKTLILALARSR